MAAVFFCFFLSICIFPLASRHGGGVRGGGNQLGVYDLTRGKYLFLLRIYFGDFLGLSTDKDIISQAISTI